MFIYFILIFIDDIYQYYSTKGQMSMTRESQWIDLERYSINLCVTD